MIYYEWRQGHNARQAHENINSTLGEGSVSRWTVHRWFNRSVAGNTCFQDNVHSGRPRPLDNDELLSALKSRSNNPRIGGDTQAEPQH
ncbi:hypothetical protein K8353_48420, partial [Burkholderia contaminans]|nr:hypothetical protein [Burkholderia contaminans]